MKNSCKLLLFFLPLFFIFSCKNSFDLVKRHYNKGFYVAHSHTHKTERNTSNENPGKASDKTSDLAVSNVTVEQENVQAKPSVRVENNEEKIAVAAKKPSGTQKQKAHSGNLNVATKTFAGNNTPTIKEKAEKDLPASGAMSDGAKLFLYILLALILPPLAIYMWQDKITKWFWIAVVLCALSYFGTFVGPVFGLWFAAFIIALLVILEVIS